MKFINWRENLLVVGGMIALTLVFVFCIESPLRRSVRQAEQELQTSRTMLGGFPGHVQELEGLQSRLQRSRDYLKQVQKLVPGENHVDQVLEMVTGLGQKGTLNITRLEPIAPIDMESYQLLPFRLVADGTYEDIHQFCYSLESGERLFGVDELTLSAGDEESGGQVGLEMVFTAYVDRSVQ